MNFLDGELVLIDKSLEWTSFDVVNKVRYLIKNHLQVKKIKVGHAGTLDPLATGLLIICTGKMTRQIETYQAQKKEYVTTLKLGATTASFDRECEEDAVFPFEHITQDSFTTALNQFLGETEQIPPMFSAKKVDGQKAYLAARQGKEIELKPNKIVIYSIDLLEFSLPYAKIKISCSKGTYIRALAHDIGQALNSGAYLHDLRRTRIGDFKVEDAMQISEFEKFMKNLEPI